MTDEAFRRCVWGHGMVINVRTGTGQSQPFFHLVYNFSSSNVENALQCYFPNKKQQMLSYLKKLKRCNARNLIAD